VAVAAEPRSRLAVLRALGLGDLLTVVPVLRALARTFPEHRRLLLAPRWLEPLLPAIRENGQSCLDGFVDVAGLDTDPGLLPRRVDLAVNLHGRGPESHRLLLAAEPRLLLAYRHEKIETGEEMPGWDPDEHETTRWCRLLRHAGIEANAAELEIECPRRPLPERAYGATLLHPGAASAARQWPPERWAAVARAELEAGHEVYVTGSRGEMGLARALAMASGLDSECQLAGRTNIRDLSALVAAAGTVVCGDTGVAHLATALGAPSVLLFGPTSPAHWGPPEDRGIHRVLWEGRGGDPHGETTDPGLLEIGVDAVLAALSESRAVAA
jgi:ADP-heptose:LPS heptosyltransferase